MVQLGVFSHLERKGLSHINPGLERIRLVLEKLGLQKPPFLVAQVVGTNGKGSTTSFLSALALAHKLKVGTHTSPHFLSPLERICINGQALTEKDWNLAFSKLVKAGGTELSYFECVTALSLIMFAEHKVDIAFMETGLGGTWDATTAIHADLVLFTTIAKDHQAVLGNSVAAIAKDKAGAMRQNTPSFSVSQEGQAEQELLATAKEKNSSLLFVAPASTQSYAKPVGIDNTAGAVEHLSVAFPTNPPKLSLAGAHQNINSALALAGWRYLATLHNKQTPAQILANLDFIAQPLNKQTEAEGLATAKIAGRMQFIPAKTRGQRKDVTHSFSHKLPNYLPYGLPPTILDGAHNPNGLAALGLSLAKQGIAPLAVVFACLEDKEIEAMLPHLRSLATGAVFVPPIKDNPRAMPPEKLAALIGLNAFPTTSLQDALEKSTAHMYSRMPELFEANKPDTPNFDHPLLICGSLYLLAEFFAIFPEDLGK